MGDRILKYYKYVNDSSGLPGKMQLATLTKVPSTTAAICEDSPEVLAKFREAVEKITGKPAPTF